MSSTNQLPAALNILRYVVLVLAIAGFAISLLA